MNYIESFKQKIFQDIPYLGLAAARKRGSMSPATAQGDFVSNKHGLNLDELRKEAGLEWDDIKDDLAALQNFAHSLRVQRMRDRGEVPPEYKFIAYCRGCGPVWLWSSGKVEGCPWCWNRLQGKPVPYPADDRKPAVPPSS
jgi:rRNA maturation endonuclease Nob1